MARLPRIHFPDAIFHVMSRGNGGEKIFHAEADWSKFLEMLAAIKRARPFKLHAFCLMPNHFHLLIQVLQTPVDKIMQLIQTRYSKYLNARLARKGHVFQGRYKALLCQHDGYLLQLLRYIHLNPVRAKLVTHPDQWPWSGHHEYVTPKTGDLVDTEFLLSMLAGGDGDGARAYRAFVEEGLVDARDPGPLPAAEILSRECPTAVTAACQEGTLNALCKQIACKEGLSPSQLTGPRRLRRISAARRKFAGDAFARGFSFAQIAVFLNVTRSAVSRSLRSNNSTSQQVDG